LVSAFLENRKEKVIKNKDSSFSKAVARGIPQGSVLGPILFVIYIIDLPDCLKNDSDIHLYADDTKIIHNIKHQEDCEKLQEDIHCMQEWSEKWLLKFHPDKCK